MVLVVIGVGCSLVFFCFADDIVLLAPCASALRKMLSLCYTYATSHGLIFNTEKTQLICFRKCAHPDPADIIEFNGVKLNFSDTVLHLGHLISFDLNDQEDIVRATKDINRKANSMMCFFGFSDPIVLTYLFKTYCLPLYGCILWSLSSHAIKHLQIAINKILRRIWHLPRNSHTSIVLKTSNISFV